MTCAAGQQMKREPKQLLKTNRLITQRIDIINRYWKITPDTSRPYNAGLSNRSLKKLFRQGD